MVESGCIQDWENKGTSNNIPLSYQKGIRAGSGLIGSLFRSDFRTDDPETENPALQLYYTTSGGAARIRHQASVRSKQFCCLSPNKSWIKVALHSAWKAAGIDKELPKCLNHCTSSSIYIRYATYSSISWIVRLALINSIHLDNQL